MFHCCLAHKRPSMKAWLELRLSLASWNVCTLPFLLLSLCFVRLERCFDSLQVLVHSPVQWQGLGKGARAGAGHAMQVSHLCDRNPATCILTAASQDWHWQKAGIRSQIQELDLGTPVRSTSLVTAGPCAQLCTAILMNVDEDADETLILFSICPTRRL